MIKFKVSLTQLEENFVRLLPLFFGDFWINCMVIKMGMDKLKL